MEFGIFNLMGSRDPEKPTAEIFAEVAEQTRLADQLGYSIAWFAEHQLGPIDVLISNALWHGDGTVTIEAHEAGPAVAIDVSDEGAGLPAEPAELLAGSAERAAGLAATALEAARADEDIAAVAAQLMSQREVMASWLVDGIMHRSALRGEPTAPPPSTRYGR